MEATCYRHDGVVARIVCQRCDRPICTECMISSEVGFHCPDCVRSAPRPKVRHVSASRATSMSLIAINFAVWALVLATGWHASPLVEWLALTPQGLCAVSETHIALVDQAGCVASGHTWVPGFATGAYWQALTSGFTHLELWHVGFNMMALYVLGPQLESFLGRGRFLTLYLLSGLAASLVVVCFSTPFAAVLGASGSLFGMMGAILVIALQRKLDMRGILGWLAINGAITFLVPNVSWEGHLGGFLGGLAVTATFMYLPRGARRYEKWLLAALALLIAVGLGAAALWRF